MAVFLGGLKASNVNIGSILTKDNGMNKVTFEVKDKNATGALIEVKESTFENSSRFAKGKTVVVDSKFLEKNTRMADKQKQIPNINYERLPLSTILYGGRNASKAELSQKRKTVRSFIDNAKEGDTYKVGSGFGSGTESFTIVHFNRSPNKLGIKSGGRTVALSTTNATKYLTNGARLIDRK